ncbi:phosphatase PAP2 family protein [Naumannella sp. ID2617S]|nr:phosphatase PAP2 family protein [Naumannella sp. ID2617S]
MARRSPSPTATATIAVLAVGFAVWTWLVTAGQLDGLDRATLHRGLSPHSPAAQILSAVALLTWPGVLYAVLAGIALWAFQRRLRNLAVAIGLSIVLGWGSHLGLKWLIGRTRPHTPLDVITHAGWAYPSGHVVAATVTAFMIAAAVVVTRQSFTRRLASRLIGGLAVVGVALDRWAMNAHWLSDLVGGALLGGLVASASLVIAGVRVLPSNPLEIALARPKPVQPEGERKRCAVIFNPTKVLDVTTFRRHVAYEAERRGWEPPLWLETSRHDPGYEMARLALEREVDLVLGAGGDGTIRAICEVLADSETPFAVIPAGTGNLLARNLEIPLDESEALRAAFLGRPERIDLVRLTVDRGTDHEHSHVFGVMAGIGIDATIMDRTDADLKKAVGNAAYFLAAAQSANHPPLPVAIRVDDGEWFRRRASVLLIGNVGLLTNNIRIIPGASATDGLLDLLVASPRTAADWVRLTTKVLTRTGTKDRRMDLIQGRRVEVRSERSDAYQLDGDTEGRCSTLLAEVMPSSLTVMLP